MAKEITDYDNKDVVDLLIKEKISSVVIEICSFHDIDGQCLLSLEDRDFHEHPFDKLKLGDKKRFILFVKKLQKNNRNAMYELGLCEDLAAHSPSTNINFVGTNLSHLGYNIRNNRSNYGYTGNTEIFNTDVRASRLKPEIWKTALALGKFNTLTVYFYLIIV